MNVSPAGPASTPFHASASRTLLDGAPEPAPADSFVSATVHPPSPGKAARIAAARAVATASAETVAAGPEPAPLPEKEWTILHYCGANNNLSSYRIENMNEMETVGSRDNVNIVAQLQLKGMGCKRYYVTQDNDPRKITSPVVQDLGRMDMADPGELADFIKFGMKQYPAKHYMLIMASHGLAWAGLQLGNYGVDMSVPQLREGIEKGEKAAGHKLDVLAFDACLMGSTEAAYELKDTARYMVASEQVEGFKAWRYATILARAFAEQASVSPEQLGTLLVDEAAKVKQDAITMGFIDLARMDDVKSSVAALADQILATDAPMSVLRDIAEGTQGFYWPVRDLHHFAEQIVAHPEIKDEKLVQAARTLVGSLEGAVVKEEHSTSIPPDDLITDSDILNMSPAERAALFELNHARGLSVEINPEDRSYQELRFAEDTSWARAMARIHEE